MDTDIRIALREIAGGIRSDVFKSYEAINLLQMVSANASDINDSGFGIFFGRFQIILQEQIILLLSKIFEKPGEFPLKSIPAAEKLIAENRQAFIQIESNGENVLMLLRKLGYRTAKKNDTVTDAFCKHWQNHIGKMKSTRQKIEVLRSKISAHHENVHVKLLPDVSLSEAIELLELTKDFLAIIDSAYLGVISVDYEGNYFVNSDSKAASLILKNLLVKARVIDARKGREIAKALQE